MSIPKYLKNLLNTGEASDFSIFVLDAEGNKIEKKAHRIVIRQCPYFSAMLDLKGTEANSGSATIDNITSNIFDYVLHYIYTEELNDTTMAQVGKIAVAADYLQLDNLRTAALDRWKDSVAYLDSRKDVIEAFRVLIALSLNIKLDESWCEARALLLLSMYDDDIGFKIAEESDSFIEFFIDSFGESHPCLAAHTLAKWASADDVKLIDQHRDNRKRRAEELLTKISLTTLSLQTLVVLSKVEVFPDSYMLKVSQERTQRRDSPVYGKVEYSITLKKARIIELEFESSYVLFYFAGLEEIQDASKPPMAWSFLHVPPNCETKVKIWLTTGKDTSWPVKSMGGTFGTPRNLKQCQFPSGEFRFAVSLTHEGEGENTIKYDYKLVYDE